MNGLGGMVGLVFGVGLYIVMLAVGPVRARRYVLRIEGFARPARSLPRRDAAAFITPGLGRSIAVRQARAGFAVDPSAHVLSVLTTCSAALAVGAAVLAALAIGGGIHQPAAALPMLALCVAAAWLLADRRLDNAARARQQRAALELPVLAESLAIAVSAGAALPHACELIAARSDGVLASELKTVVEELRNGGSFDGALARVPQRVPTAAVGRFIDALRIAMERGTPIADVLHAQAADARNESRRVLMERAGRREVAMLIPVVFCVLPAVVVIALYPGFRELTSMV